MRVLWQLFYNVIIIPLFWIGFRLLGLVDRKIQRGIAGRNNLFEHLEARAAGLHSAHPRVWFHSSSMGEFEQAKPIIAALKTEIPEIEIVVSFFSPSGYEPSRSFKLADIITYLPFDSHRQAKRFIDLIKPSVAVMVRYDIWPNHLWALQRAGIPVFLASATLRPKTLRRLPVLKQFHRHIYNIFDYILTVSQADKKVFEMFDIERPVLEVVGDTRYDQVWRKSAESKGRHLLPSAIVGGKKVIVVGSSWQEDDEHLLPALARLAVEREDLLIVLVPHEPTVQNLEVLEAMLGGRLPSIRLSTLADYAGEKVIIIDSVGILMALYQYAAVAYVGGSFHQGIHNVLEPASYGIPLVIGPRHGNSQEAVELVAAGAAFVGESEGDLLHHLSRLFSDDHFRTAAGRRALEFVRGHIGATERLLGYLRRALSHDHRGGRTNT